MNIIRKVYTFSRNSITQATQGLQKKNDSYEQKKIMDYS